MTLLAVIPGGLWLLESRSLGGVAVTSVGTGGRRFNVGQFLSYVWQYYLPRLPFMTRLRLVPGIPLVTIWLDEGAGRFGWLSVNLPAWMTLLAKYLLGVAAVGTVVALSRLRERRRLALLLVDALALICLLGVLHVTEYRQWLGTGTAFLQGRYILPVASLLGLAVGVVLTRLPRSIQPTAAGLVLIGLLAGQVLSLSTVVHAYYV